MGKPSSSDAVQVPPTQNTVSATANATGRQTTDPLPVFPEIRADRNSNRISQRMKPTASPTWMIATLVIGGALVGAIVFFVLTETRGTYPQKSPNLLTQQSLNSLKVGMTLQEVESLIGPNHRLLADFGITQTYQWTEGPEIDVRSIVINIQAGKLSMKMGSNLPR